jgi:hypothetical protein
MKRALFAAAVIVGFLATTSDVQAQGITIGALGGYNYSELSDLPSGISEVGQKGGLAVGAFVDINLTGFFVSVEGLYVENKAETDGTDTFQQTFIQVPVYLGYRFLSGMVRPALYAGGTASFETDCSVEVEGFPSTDCADDLVGISTNSAIWGAVFGGGVDVAVGPVILTGDIRYNLGLSKISDTDDSKWNSWMVLVGIGFGLGV